MCMKMALKYSLYNLAEQIIFASQHPSKKKDKNNNYIL